MSVTTVYSNAADNAVRSGGSGYTWVQTQGGANLYLRGVTSTYVNCGSDFFATYAYIEQFFMWFDTSGIGDTDLITDVTLSLAFRNYAVPAHTFDIDVYVGGAADTIATSDYVPIANLAGMTKLAHVTIDPAWATWNTYVALTIDDLTALKAAINKTGHTRLFCVSSTAVSAVAPDSAWDHLIQAWTGDEVTQPKPKLVVTHQAANATSVAATLGALSMSATVTNVPPLPAAYAVLVLGSVVLTATVANTPPPRSVSAALTLGALQSAGAMTGRLVWSEGQTYTLSWEASTDPDVPITYEAEFSALGTFVSDAVAIFSGVATTTYDWTPAYSLVNADTTTCRLRIRARDAADELSGWAYSEAFTLLNVAASAVLVLGSLTVAGSLSNASPARVVSLDATLTLSTEITVANTPPPRDATADLALGSLECVSVASITGARLTNGDLTLGALVAAGSMTRVQPARTLSAALVLNALQTTAALETFSLVGELVLGSLQVTASLVNIAPLSLTASLVLGAVQAAGTLGNVPPPRTTDADLILGLVLQATATAAPPARTVTAAITLGTLISDSTVSSVLTPTPPLGNELRVLNASGVLVGIAPASLRRRERLTGPNLLEQIQVPQDYLLDDGTTESRWWMIDQGYQLLYEGGRYIIDVPTTDFETGGTLTATSAEVELQNFDTNYSPGPATYLNRTPTQILDAVLSGKVGRLVRNPGFGILDSSDLPTNWTHPTGWTSQLVNNRRVWQADAGSDESVSDLRPCTPGISYRVALDINAPVGMAGTASVLIRWRKTDGTTVDSAATVASETGAFVTIETGDIVALGNKLSIVLKTTGTNQVVQFDDVRLYEIGPDTTWTYDGSMDTRAAWIPFTDGAIVKYGVWTKGATDLSATAVGDYIGRVINGAFVTIGFAAGGVGAQAKIRVNGVVKVAALDVSSTTSYTVDGLDPANDHIVEVEVVAVKVAVTGFTVSTVNLISMRWDYKTVYEAVASVAKAVGGELSFDTVTKVITHAPTIGVDLRATNVVDFRRASNLVKFTRRHDRTGIVNRLTGLGYGEGEYQLVVTVDATGLNADGVTSQSLYDIRRGKTSNKDWKDLATAVTECQRIVEAAAFGTNTYTTETTDAVASLCSPGDTAHFLYRDEEVSLRILEVQRTNDGGTATLVVGDKAEALEDVVSSTRRDLATLQRSYQGVPTDTNDSFSEQFDRTSGGVDTPAECSFYVPYGADLMDLRARYQIGGMRAFAKSVGGGGGTNTPSGGGSTSGYDGGQTSSSGGSSTPTSSSVTTPSGGGSTTPSGGGSTSGTTVQDDKTIPYFTRSPTASSVWYEVRVNPTLRTAEYIYVIIGNYTGGTRSFSVEVRTAAGGGGTLVGSGSLSNVVDGDTGAVAITTSSYSSSSLYVRAIMTTAGGGTWLWNPTRYGMQTHSHTTPAHTHATPDHTHPAHTHTLTIGGHTHTVPSHYHSTPNHVHVLPDHAHTLAYGIYESGTPATVRVYLDGALISALNDLTYVNDFDLLPFIGKDSNGRVQEGWHTLSFYTATASATGSVRGTVFAQKFLSVAG